MRLHFAPATRLLESQPASQEPTIAAPSSTVETSASSRTTKRYLSLGLLAMLAWFTWGAFRSELGIVPLLSDIDLAIHEFGHMLFMPFGIPVLGSTMMILGGSLTQVALPLIFVGYFLRKTESGARRDVFAAMVCVWWSAINLLSVAIYCADSRAGQLMLLDGSTGQESDGHDWYNLLSRWGLLEHDTQIARVMRGIAALVAVAGITVALLTLLNRPAAERSAVANG